MSLGDITVASNYLSGNKSIRVNNLVPSLAAFAGVPNQVQIYHAATLGLKSQTSGVYSITSAGGNLISGLTFLSGTDGPWVAGDLVVLQFALPATGLELDQYASKITSDTAVSNTFTCDLSVSNWHTCTLGASSTIAVSNGVNGQQFTVVLVQDGTGSRAVTWFSGIKWAGGSPPTLTTTINKADIFTFKQTAAGAYYGMVAGQNF